MKRTFWSSVSRMLEKQNLEFFSQITLIMASTYNMWTKYMSLCKREQYTCIIYIQISHRWVLVYIKYMHTKILYCYTMYSFIWIITHVLGSNPNVGYLKLQSEVGDFASHLTPSETCIFLSLQKMLDNGQFLVLLLKVPNYSCQALS